MPTRRDEQLLLPRELVINLIREKTKRILLAISRLDYGVDVRCHLFIAKKNDPHGLSISHF
ncbi:hypothetical protein WT63_20165 [Burkholderia anthina]|nr:hypothetical protein WT63_20165 [Burkholderia anthina]